MSRCAFFPFLQLEGKSVKLNYIIISLSYISVLKVNSNLAGIKKTAAKFKRKKYVNGMSRKYIKSVKSILFLCSQQYSPKTLTLSPR